jgi:hypothetical protein
MIYVYKYIFAIINIYAERKIAEIHFYAQYSHLNKREIAELKIRFSSLFRLFLRLIVPISVKRSNLSFTGSNIV